MKTTPYTFTITNTCDGKAAYNVNLEALEGTDIKNTSVRVALDSTNKLYSEYDMAEKYYDTSIESRRLISGRLEANESVTYNLRLWIDEAVTLEEQDKVFKSKIVVNANEDFDDPLIENINATSTHNSITITYQANGDVTPATCKYGTSSGNYTNEVNGATLTSCNITGLTDDTTYYYQICTETKKGSKCEEGNIKTTIKPATNISEVKVGDYIKMTPTSTSYTISKDLTGYTSNQTINPSELNIWRVIKVNGDGSVDAVSANISNKNIYLRGETGFKNLVGTLNTIASQYTNTKYVSKARSVGYDDQIERCSSQSSVNCPSEEYSSSDKVLLTSIYNFGAVSPDGKKTKYFMAGRLNSETLLYRYKEGTSSPSVDDYTDVCTGATISINKTDTRKLGTMTVDARIYLVNVDDKIITESLFLGCGTINKVVGSVRPILTFIGSTKIISGEGNYTLPYILE